MGVCNFTIKINNQDMLFRSQEDLNKFLFDNREILNAYRLDPKFSREFTSGYDAQESAVSKLQANSKKGIRKVFTNSQSMDLHKKGEKNEGGDFNTITGTNVHSLPLNPSGRPFITQKNLDNYKEEMTKKILKEQRGRKIEDIHAELDEEIATWDKMAEYGTDLHKIPEMIFSTETVNPVTVLDEIRKSNPNTKISNENVLDMISGLQDVKAYLDNVHNNPTYMTEVEVEVTREDGKKVKGIIDLIAIDKNGIPHIYDFKTANKNIRHFKQIKTQSYRYQLGLYRQILGHMGFNVKNSVLGIIPISMDNVDYKNDTIGGIGVSTNDIQILTNETEKMMFGHGYIWQNLHRVLPTKLGSFSIGSDFVSDSTAIVEGAFSYNSSLSTSIKNVKKFIKGLERKNGKVKLYNKLDKNWEYINEEDAEVRITEYLEQLNEVKFTAAKELGDMLSPYIEGARDVLRTEKTKKAGFDKAQYAEYYKSGWSINREFEHLGLVILTNEASQVMDVISVTANPLDQEIELPYGKTIMGNFISDAQITDEKILTSNIGNIELLRSMFIINELIAKDKIPNGYKMGQFKVVDHKGSTAFQQNQVYLYNSFDTITKYLRTKQGLDINNNFNTKMPLEKFEDKIVRIFQNLIDNGDAFPTAESILKAFQDSNTGNITARLVRLLGDLREWGASTSTTSFDTGVSKLSFLVSEAINHYYNASHNNDLEMTMYTDGFNFEYQIKDVAKWSMPSRGTLTSLPTVAADNFTTSFENRIMIPARQKMIHEINKLGNVVRTSFEEMRKESLHLGFRENIYDNCFEQGVNGEKFDDHFRVKNPYSQSSNLTSGERSYLKTFLEQLNLLRYGELSAEERQSYINSGEWFEVPLMRSELANKLTDGGTIKEFIKEKIDEVTNVNEQLDEAMRKKEKQQHKDFEEYVNSFEISADKRLELLSKNGTKAYSRDLSAVLLSFGLKSIQSNTMAKVLPIARASIIFNNAFFDLNNIDANEFQEYLMKYLQTSVYEKMHIPDNLKNQAAFIQTLSGLMAKAALSMNALSISRELVQGVYNNFLRVLTRHMAIDPPSVKDLAFSYTQVSGKMLKDIKHNNKLNGLAMQFHGILGGSLKTLVEDLGVNSNSIGGKLFKGDIMFKGNQFPDFLHRISLLIAFMKKDGCYDSYSWNGETLEYNWKSDKRFELFVKYGENPPSDPKLKEEYEKQRGLYGYMIRSFADQGLAGPDGGYIKYGDPLPMAYTSNQIATIKDIIDQTHGHMSGYTKTQMERTMYGSMYMMFKSYVKSKVNTYSMKSGKYVQGEVVPLKDPVTGEQKYRHIITREDGSTYEEVNDDSTDGMMEYKFIPSFQEGIWDSLVRSWELYKKHGLLEGFDKSMNDEVIKRNLKYLSSDLFICLCLFAISKLAFDWDEIEDKYGYTLSKIFQTPFQAPMDNNPLQFINTVIGTTEPPVIAMTGSWLTSILNVGASPSLENLNKVAENVAVYRIANDLRNQFSND